MAALNLALGITIYVKETQTRNANHFGTAYGTWYMPITNRTVSITTGDNVPFVLAEATNGIVESGTSTFILPNDGVYMCTAYAVTCCAPNFFDLILNPASSTPITLAGSEFTADAQQDTEGINPVTITFQASAGDEIALVFVSPASTTITLGTGAIVGPNNDDQPIAFMQLLEVK